MSEVPRRDARISSTRGLLVRCDSWSEFVQHYATDISQGGMFIVTDEPPELLSEIHVQVSLPEGHDVQMRAQVVHIIDKAQAERAGRPAGIGVQFLELDAVRRTQIHQLVEFARWEGSTGRPAASLASRMFEAAASLPPARLIDGLPGPGAGTSAPAPNRAPKDSASSTPAKPQVSRAPTPAPMPAVNPAVTAPVTAPVTPAAKSAAPSERPRSGAPPKSSQAPPAEAGAASASQAPSIRTSGKPLDTDRLKIGMTHLAHKRFMEAINVFSELSTESPQDPQPVLWRALARARLKLKDNDEPGAAEHYAQVLAIDENNHEARKFVREHGQKKRLEKLPFGRFFSKKK